MLKRELYNKKMQPTNLRKHRFATDFNLYKPLRFSQQHNIVNSIIKLPIKRRDEIMVTTLDKFGRVLIPKKFREHLGIGSNTSLNISEDGKRIVIELVQEKEPLVDKDGILVFTGKLDNKKSRFIQNFRTI